MLLQVMDTSVSTELISDIPKNQGMLFLPISDGTYEDDTVLEKPGLSLS